MILPRTSEGLYLLQRVRDEAHRFAITYHRQQAVEGDDGSALDEVPGLGPAPRQALIKHFGSVKRLRAATVDGATAARVARTAVPRASGAAARASPRRRHGEASRRPAWTRAAATSEPDGGRPTSARGPDSSSSPACPGRAGAPPPSAWRTWAGSSSTTCRPACCRHGRAGRPGQAARRHGWPPWSTCAAGPSPPTCSGAIERAGGARRRRARGLPGGQRRRAGPPVRERAPPAPAAGRRPAGRRHRRASASCCARSAASADLVIDTSDLNVHELRAQDRRASSAASDRRRPAASTWSRSATSTACRSTPTWSSTAGSCPTRTGSPSCAP